MDKPYKTVNLLGEFLLNYSNKKLLVITTDTFNEVMENITYDLRF